ncbi:hypothetical protein HOP61_21250 [Halomonas daqingensis]|uniref:Uncharacterized protein n=1 Tax=Billgrantia desiderata TaxID=52021 RepID=A0AAW4YZM7_9GAMM|nr:hypothetical protein [Halomonas desiderata]MCE8053825.1 hypothetical protein [Halomonas desiderata]
MASFDTQRLLVVFFISFILCLSRLSPRFSKFLAKISPRAGVVFLLGLVFVGVEGVLFNGALFVHLLEFSYLVMVLSLLAFIYVFSGERLFYWVAGGLVTFLIAIYAIHSFFDLFQMGAMMRRRDLTLGFANIRLFSDVAVGLMPLALLYIVSRPRPSMIAAVLCFLPLSFWWYLLFLSEGRAGILSLVMAMVIALALFRQSAYWPVATLFGASLAGLAGWWFVNPLRRTVEGQEIIFHRDITSPEFK